MYIVNNNINKAKQNLGLIKLNKGCDTHVLYMHVSQVEIKFRLKFSIPFFPSPNSSKI